MSNTRFFPGWTWVYDRDPNLGLCYPGVPEEAARLFFQDQSYWDKREKCYTLTGPDDEPVEWRKENL